MELRHLVLLFRHGDRSPITKTCGKNLTMSEEETQYWINSLATAEVMADAEALSQPANASTDCKPHYGGSWPNGQLSTRGALAMRKRGEILRKKYADLLDSGANASNGVHIRSTNIVRTVQSVQQLLLGLFPELVPKTEGGGDDDDSVVFRIKTLEKMTLAPPHLPSDIDTIEPAASGVDTASLDPILRKAVGLEDHEELSYTIVREILVCRKAHGLPFPNGITEEIFEQILKYNAFEWHSIFSNRASCHSRIATGVEEVCERIWEMANDGGDDQFLSLYSVHDTTVVAFCYAIGIHLNMIPPYGSTLAMELLRDPDTQENYIKFVFEDEPTALNVPSSHHHEHLYSISQFKEIVDDFLAKK